MVTINFNEKLNRWEGRSDFSEKVVFDQHKWVWDPVARCRWTKFEDRVIPLLNFASGEDKARLEKARGAKEEQIALSYVSNSNETIPGPPDKDYFPFQKAGIQYLKNYKRVILGDEQGLGKTIQVIGLINSVPTINRTLIVCPASLKLNWAREIGSWLIRPIPVYVVDSKTENIPWEAESGIFIMNYDIAYKFPIKKHGWDLFVMDEAHRVKSRKARRTVSLLGDYKVGDAGVRSEYAVAVSGTPMPNRPVELWNLLSFLRKDKFNSFMGYAKRYCGAYQNRYGWDMTGATHMDELAEVLRSTLMIRRMKKDVMTDLPPKIRQVIPMSSEGVAEVGKERAIMNSWEDALVSLNAEIEIIMASDDEVASKEAAISAIRERTKVMFDEMSAVRRALGIKKAKAVVEELVEQIDDEPESKLVVFAHHHEVIDIVTEAFGSRAVKMTGEMNAKDRQESVDRFQNDPSVNVFVGSIRAAGEGITLTASSRVVFLELDWVPAVISQAEDRLHRIGAKGERILIQHYIFEGSLDERLVCALLEKQKIAEMALDSRVVLAAPIIPMAEDAKDKAFRVRSAEKDKQIEITDDQVAMIHAGLRMLSMMCDGAVELDGMGFNKFDSRLGKSLAAMPKLSKGQAILGAKLVRKYRRQLEPEIGNLATDILAKK